MNRSGTRYNNHKSGMKSQKFLVRFSALFIFAWLATIKIWLSTQSMTFQRQIEHLQDQLQTFETESNRLLRQQAELTQRDRLRDTALTLGYQAPDKTLYVINP